MNLYGKENISMFDNWSLAHFLSGAFVGLTGIMNAKNFLILHTVWEFIENTVGIGVWNNLGWHEYKGDTMANVIGDTISAMAGFYAFKVGR